MRCAGAVRLVLLVLAMARAAHADGMALLVPAYFEPESGLWPALAAAAARVPVVAIANVNNGPGSDSAPIQGYVAAMRAVREAGGQVVGYVFTQYGKRSLDLVKKDMQHWVELYSLDGFFVDEMANSPAESLLSYYAELARYARQIQPNSRVIANPGTNTDELYLTRTTADVLVIFENDAGYLTFAPTPWTQRYPEHQFAHLTYAVSRAAQMTNFVNLAASRRAGFIYVTDDGGNNPWDTLPSYWEAEVGLVESLNRDAAERLSAQLTLAPDQGATFTLSAQGAAGRYVLEAASPLGDWHPVSTNLTNTGTSVWRVLNVPPNRFFRARQD